MTDSEMKRLALARTVIPFLWLFGLLGISAGAALVAQRYGYFALLCYLALLALVIGLIYRTSLHRMRADNLQKRLDRIISGHASISTT